jgi:pimeloyl-ACP methyl ester carboxylesterase
MVRRSLLFALAMVLAYSVQVVAAEHHTFDSDGVKIHYLTEGEGEPVLLIHGFTASAPTQWMGPGIFQKLAQDYRVIALDNRGHGKSDKPHDPEKYGIEMVRDSIRLLDHLDIKKAHIVGYSMGGFITLKLITEYPERVQSATLGGAGWNRPDDEQLIDWTNELAESLEQGTGIAPLIRRLTPEGQPKPSDDQIALMNQFVLASNDAKALAAVIRGMRGLTVQEEKIKEIRLPVLSLIGSKDPLKQGVDLLSGVMGDGLKVTVIEDTDHMTAYGRKQFVEALGEFLKAHSASESASPVAAP